MGSAEDVDLVQRGYQAFSVGDMATLNGLFAEDAVWHVPGSGDLAGTKQGREAILEFFGELMSRSAGTLKVAVQDVVGGENHTIGLSHDHAERNGKVFDQSSVLVFGIRDGRVSEVRQYFEDTAENDEFWS